MFKEHGRSIEAVLSRFLDGEIEPGDGAALVAAMEKDDQFADEVRRLLAFDDLLRQVAGRGEPAVFLAALQTRLAVEADGDRFTQVVLDRLPEAAADRAGIFRILKERERKEKGAPPETPPAPRRLRWVRFRPTLARAAFVLLALGAAWQLASSSIGLVGSQGVISHEKRRNIGQDRAAREPAKAILPAFSSHAHPLLTLTYVAKEGIVTSGAKGRIVSVGGVESKWRKIYRNASATRDIVHAECAVFAGPPGG